MFLSSNNKALQKTGLVPGGAAIAHGDAPRRRGVGLSKLRLVLEVVDVHELPADVPSSFAGPRVHVPHLDPIAPVLRRLDLLRGIKLPGLSLSFIVTLRVLRFDQRTGNARKALVNDKYPDLLLGHVFQPQQLHVVRRLGGSLKG